MRFKGIIKDQYNFPNISLKRFYLGIITGIFTCISCYLFFYGFRETIRIIFSFNENLGLWILSDKEIWFYNLVFAFISSIFGEAFCLKIWYEKPKHIFKPYFNYKQKIIYNEITVLNINFLNVFFKISIIYGIWIGLTFNYLDFSLYPKYNYVWFLIIIVLHLEQWKTIRLVFKNRSLKVFGLFTISIVVISFLLSFINPIKIKNINNSYLSKCINYNYIIDRPTSDIARPIYRQSIYMNLYYVFPKKKNNNLFPVLLIENEKINKDSLCFHINKERKHCNKSDSINFIIHLHCDKNIKMKYIKEIKYRIAKCGINYISYSVIPNNLYPFKNKFMNYGIKDHLPNHNAFKGNENIDINYFVKPPVIKVEIIDSSFISINGLIIPIKNMAKGLKQAFNIDKFRQIQLYSNNNVDYQTYISVRDFMNKAIINWRNQKAYDNYNKSYNKLKNKEKDLFDSLNHFKYLELTDQIKRKVDNF